MKAFWSKVDKNGPVHPQLGSRCWLWTGAKLKGSPGLLPYGLFSLNGKTSRAHRVAWMLEHGELPRDHVLHRCDNPSCVNPAHLFIGSQLDNMRDRSAKGRQPKGSNHPNSKLSEDAVATIRARLAAGETQTSIAKLVGISQQVISDIKTGKIWTA